MHLVFLNCIVTGTMEAINGRGRQSEVGEVRKNMKLNKEPEQSSNIVCEDAFVYNDVRSVLLCHDHVWGHTV